MHRSRRRCLLIGLALLAPLPSVRAQGTPSREVVRGTIAAVEGQRLSLRTPEGATVSITLADSTRYASVSKASLDQITPGAFIGTAATPDAKGELVAQEVHIFPESMRGTGEGHRPWNRGPQSTMTNATVSKVGAGGGPAAGRTSTMTNATVSSSGTSGSARRLQLAYKDGSAQGEKTVVVPPEAPVVMLAPGDRSLLAPGAHVTAIVLRQPDGGLTAAAVNVGKDGLVPPM